MNEQITKVMIALVFFSLLSSCRSYLDTVGFRDETVYPAVYPVDNPPPPKSNGTIYQSGHEIFVIQ